MRLQALDIEVHFGGVQAVAGVSLDVGDECVGIVGPNGSGKTTFLNALTGVVAARGSLAIEGRKIRMGRPARVSRAGVGRMFQAPQVFAELTCLENILVADSDRRLTGMMSAWLGRPLMLRRERVRWRNAWEILDRFGLADHAHSSPAELSYGNMRRLELGRVLAGKPRVLLLDEPSAGLNDGESAELAQLLRELRADGLAMVLIDHKIHFLNEVCDRVVVLDRGTVIAHGTPQEVWAHDSVREAYLGGRKHAGD